ncbi:LPS-assembly lipoprotein LptE [Kushneria pakistanensis]|uniref:LPS-assembly lipoprotein LptE n=1 Tax=Kushneria pakistanensis TaxID=1508770 RepID=UPI00167700AA|nr:LPS assembly lipoprotein LptE [Kushneria pakistanensis]
MKRRAFLAGLAGAGLVLMLAGCGFQLRGTGPGSTLTLGELALESAGGPTSELTREITQELNSAGVTLNDQAPLRLNLSSEAFRERELTYGDAGTQERQLTLTVPWSLQRVADGAYLASQEEVVVSGTFYTSSDQLLTRDDAREALKSQLYQNAARRLIDRLQTFQPDSTRTVQPSSAAPSS